MTTADEIRSYAADAVAAGVILMAMYGWMTGAPLMEDAKILVGAATSYLLIKNSPNTV